jgi:hypothetical protein
VSLLRNQATTSSTTRPTALAVDLVETSPGSSNTSQQIPTPSVTASSSDSAPVCGPTVPSPITDATITHAVSPEEAEQCLETFRDTILPFAPLYHVTESAQQLSQKKPYLWLAILATTVKSVRRQVLLSDKFRQIITERVILGTDRSLDLLLGLLVHVAW